MDVCVINCRSVNNKAEIVKDYVVDKKSDIVAITETWLNGNESDCQTIGDLCPTGYKLLHEPRINVRGGGVGLLKKISLDIKKQRSTKFVSFEHAEWLFRSS